MSLAFASALVILLCLGFSPRWETNDDIAMSMMAHGYGIAAQGSPRLLFSKVPWGWAVRALPDLGGVPGYSVAMMLALWGAAWATAFSLLRLEVTPPVAAVATALLFLRPLLFPQFTLTAGMLVLAGVLCWLAYARLPRNTVLAAGCVLVFLGFLIRSLECLFVLGLTAPMFPWPVMRRIPVRAAAAVLVLAVAGAWLVDQSMFSDPAWQPFVERNRLRAPFTDFGVAALAGRDPALLAAHGFTGNDMDLLGVWFFMDPQLAEPARLRSVVSHIVRSASVADRSITAWTGMAVLWAPALLPLLAPALAGMVMAFDRRILVMWAGLLLALFAFAFIGRVAPERIHYPLLSALAIFPLVARKGVPGWHIAVISATLLAALAMQTFRLVPASLQASAAMAQVRRDLASLPDELIVSWGGRFPLESAYPVLGRDRGPKMTKIYGMGVFNAAPNTISQQEEHAGRGLLSRLTGKTGVLMFASDRNVRLLETYCRERLAAPLEVLGVQVTESFMLRRLRCSPAPHVSTGADIAPKAGGK